MSNTIIYDTNIQPKPLLSAPLKEYIVIVIYNDNISRRRDKVVNLQPQSKKYRGQRLQFRFRLVIRKKT